MLGDNTVPLFEMQEGIFHQMANFIDVRVISSLRFTVLLERYDCLAAFVAASMISLVS